MKGSLNNDAIAKQLADYRLCQLHKIRDADYTIARVRKDLNSRLVLNDMLGAAVVLVSVEFDNQFVFLTAIVGSELSRDLRYSGIKNNLGVQTISQEPTKRCFVEVRPLIRVRAPQIAMSVQN